MIHTRQPAERALRVLVVEAEEVVATAASAALRRRGHEVATARTVDAAREAEPHEVLVCDARLDGALDWFAEHRARERALPVIAIDGDPSVDACRRALRAGVADYLPKPFALDELVSAVESAASRPTGRVPDTRTPARFEAEYPLVPASVDRAARDLCAFALRLGIPVSSRTRFASACAEVLDNAVRHCGAGPEARLRMTAELDGTEPCPELSVRIQDPGRGFDAVAGWIESAPSLVAGSGAARSDRNTPAGGLVRAASLAEDLRVASGDGGTTVQLRFTCAPSDFPEGDAFDLSELEYLSGARALRVLRAISRGSSSAGELVNISPALAVTVGRLLTGRTPAQMAQIALWS